jgi:hypothetical protein
MDARRRGVNWLLVWIGVALLVGAGLIVGVSLVPGANVESRGADTAPAGFAGPLQDVRVGGLDLRVPADFQIAASEPCASSTFYDGSSPGVVWVDKFDWGAAFACPMRPSGQETTPTPTGVVWVSVAPYGARSVHQGDDPTKAGKIVARRHAADQTVDVEALGRGPGVLLVFTADHVVVGITPAHPADRLIDEVLGGSRHQP